MLPDRYRKLVPQLFLCFLFFSPLSVFAQDEESTTVQVITGSSAVFDSIGSRNLQPFPSRNLPDSAVSNLLKDDAYWYANVEPPKVKKKEEKAIQPSVSLTERSWFRNLMWTIIIVIFIALVIWYLATSNIRLFRRSTSLAGSEEEEVITEDIFSMNYPTELEKAIAASDYRLAIRLLYLDTLRTLSEKELITYRQEWTNSQYLSQLYGSDYYRPFFRLTRNFEYCWYGQFRISEEAFAPIRQEFESFKKSIEA
jgi:hypothetical protein